jgi:LacI family transcriptional regulator
MVHMVTIRDVARHAGVSVATVSRVINKTGFVSDDLAQRVQQAIALLGFEPDFLARTWRTRVTRTIAAVISDNTSPHHGVSLREAGAVALAHDYSLILCTTYRDPEIERRYLRMLRRRRIDGIVLNNVGDCKEEVARLADLGVPVVMLNRPLAGYGPLVDAVVVDSYSGSYALVDHLIRVGHRRIAMLCGGLHDYHRNERLRGYREALQAHGIAYDEGLIRWSDSRRPEETMPVADLLALAPPPTAIYASGYSAGLAAMTVLRAQGRRIPDDMAFVMFDDVTWGEFVDPPLTLLRNPAEELGRVAMKLLFARLADRTLPPQEVLLQPEMVVRRSCGWTGDAGVAATTRMGAAALLGVGC